MELIYFDVAVKVVHNRTGIFMLMCNVNLSLSQLNISLADKAKSQINVFNL